MTRWMTLMGLLFATSAVAKAPTLSPLDATLPIEERRVLAGAEDDLAMAQERARRLDQAHDTWRGQIRDLESALKGHAEPLYDAVKEVERARSDHWKLRAAVARAEVALAAAELEGRRLDVMIRTDRGRPRTEKTLAELDRARQAVVDARKSVEEHEVEVERAVNAQWSTLRGWFANGGDSSGLFFGLLYGEPQEVP